MPAVDPDAVTALVPCHHEPPDESLLAPLVWHVGRVMLVDDGMAPDAALRLDRLGSRLGAEHVHLPRRSGKGHAIVAGIRAARSLATTPSAVLVVDADGQHPPEAIPRFLARQAMQSSSWATGSSTGDGACRG